MPRVLKIVVIPYRCTPLQWLWYCEPTFIAYATFIFNKLKLRSFIQNSIAFKEECLSVVSAFWASTISSLIRGIVHPPHCGLRIHDSFESCLFRLGPVFRCSRSKIFRTSAIFLAAFFFWGTHMRCMIVLIMSQIKHRIIIKLRDCICDCFVDPFYVNDLGSVFLNPHR